MMQRLTGWMMLIGMLALVGACASQTETVKFTPSADAGIAGSINEAPAPGGPRPATSAAPVYTAHNMWFEKPDSVYSTGYHVGSMIPAGTQASNVAIKRGMRPKISFTTQPDGRQFTIDFVAKHHPGLSIDQFCGRYFTTKSLGQLTEGFTPEELDAVKEGALRVGMSKRAVIVAYGYPIETYTPTLQGNQWTFMENRFRKKAVNFDANGYTTRDAGVAPNTL